MPSPFLLRRTMLIVALVVSCFVPSPLRAQATTVPRAEHPRPDFMRAAWQTLNGSWEFEFDDRNVGLAEGWSAGARPLGRKIVVPYAFQSRLSGINDPSFHDVVWYRRAIDVPADWKGRRVFLHFGAVDYEATVWVNGTRVGSHQGGHVGFSFDITDALKPSGNVVVVRVWDPSTDRTIPRGKQYWRPKSESIFYTRTTGIWQPVWLEAVDPTHVRSLRLTPDIDRSQLTVDAVVSATMPGLELRATAKLGDEVRAVTTAAVTNDRPRVVVTIPNQQLWSPERPTLYQLSVELLANGKPLDRVESYFGQRKIGTHNGRVYLNDAPYYLRMVLDQGYWPESLLTPPSEDAIIYDIKMTKAFGFNGARKHQKVEDPRWLYHADRMGLLVWGEMANAYEYSPEYVERFTREWMEVVARDYNHPAIVAWVPINESWGVPEVLTNAEQQAHLKSLYHLTRSLDPTRPVVDNDGWEHTDQTDYLTLHDYARVGEELAEKYAHLVDEPSRIPRNGREALVHGARYNGTPFLMTEFGGIAYRVGEKKAENEWGYSGVEPTREAFLKRLDGLVRALRENRAFAGFCYTQLTDVEQEINGLMTYDRKPKAEPEVIAKIIGQ